jgi:hypothetical protein
MSAKFLTDCTIEPFELTVNPIENTSMHIMLSGKEAELN